MTLPDFIAELGDEEAARLLDAPLRTVQSWRRRERKPRPAQAARIIAAAEGRLDYAGIYGAPAGEAA